MKRGFEFRVFVRQTKKLLSNDIFHIDMTFNAVDNILLNRIKFIIMFLVDVNVPLNKFKE